MAKVFSELRISMNNWWVFEVLGGLLLFMGFMVFSRPVETYVGLTVWFVFTFFISGILRIIFSVTNRDQLRGWGWYFTGGLFDIALGLLLTSRLDLVTVTLPFFVGFYLLFSSVMAIAKSFDLKDAGIQNWTWTLFAGIAGIIFSCLVLFNPLFGIASLITWTALAFISVGLFYIALGLKLRKLDIKTRDFIQGPTVHA